MCVLWSTSNVLLPLLRLTFIADFFRCSDNKAYLKLEKKNWPPSATNTIASCCISITGHENKSTTRICAMFLWVCVWRHQLVGLRLPPMVYTSFPPQGIFHFQLGRGEPMLHTRLRPHCKEFLEKIAKLYELHVFTFGSRLYAHTIAGKPVIIPKD